MPLRREVPVEEIGIFGAASWGVGWRKCHATDLQPHSTSSSFCLRRIDCQLVKIGIGRNYFIQVPREEVDANIHIGWCLRDTYGLQKEEYMDIYEHIPRAISLYMYLSRRFPFSWMLTIHASGREPMDIS